MYLAFLVLIFSHVIYKYIQHFYIIYWLLFIDLYMYAYVYIDLSVLDVCL